MSRIPALILAGALGFAALPAGASSVSTAWARVTQGNQEECLAVGLRAVQAVGFTASISDSRQTVFGWRGEESLTVQCLAAHGVAVVFAWVTDQSNDSARLVDSVTTAFRGRAGPGAGVPGGPPGGGLSGGGTGGNLTGGGGLTGGNLGGGGGNLTGGGGGVVKR
ncbi:hypothetical protein J5Y09_21445 [Roseomonas sp. PWR1]|uniref:Uncharacterized protein n=1 Tax=Roseomonas nitratireducens TaxID=2820810 RepID=A0ABS4AYQ8_9PROT|nr:hypothetical protein [Neoroseomonas nitratireducens]MBP0466508.1 hypothetical protein [Neoroseomonas nitratireducens]